MKLEEKYLNKDFSWVIILLLSILFTAAAMVLTYKYTRYKITEKLHGYE